MFKLSEPGPGGAIVPPRVNGRRPQRAAAQADANGTPEQLEVGPVGGWMTQLVALFGRAVFDQSWNPTLRVVLLAVVGDGLYLMTRMVIV